MDSPTALVLVPLAILMLTSTILHGAPDRSAILRAATSTNSFPSACHTITAHSPARPLDLAILIPQSRTCTSRHAEPATVLFGRRPWLASEHLAMWPQPRLQLTALLALLSSSKLTRKHWSDQAWQALRQQPPILLQELAIPIRPLVSQLTWVLAPLVRRQLCSQLTTGVSLTILLENAFWQPRDQHPVLEHVSVDQDLVPSCIAHSILML